MQLPCCLQASNWDCLNDQRRGLGALYVFHCQWHRWQATSELNRKPFYYDGHDPTELATAGPTGPAALQA